MLKENPFRVFLSFCMTANPRQSLTGNKRTSGCFLNLATQLRCILDSLQVEETDTQLSSQTDRRKQKQTAGSEEHGLAFKVS